MKSANQNTPLVSIIVITYNSSKYVLETLESAKNQIYENIELIITDDASTDKTVQICQDWLEKNRDRFMRSNIITSHINTGVSANCNRGFMFVHGEWVKYIAGDDALKENCINDFISFINNNPDSYIISANMHVYDGSLNQSNYLGIVDRSNISFNTKNITAAEQYNILLKGNCVSSPTLIIKKIVFDNIGGFDEEMPYEDWPYMLKCTKFKYKIYFLNKCVVKYRKHNESICNNSKENKIVNDSFKRERIIYDKYIKSNINKFDYLADMVKYCLISYIFRHPTLNKKNKYLSKTFYKISSTIYHLYKKSSIKSFTIL